MTEPKPSAGHPTERPSMNTPELIGAAKRLHLYCAGRETIDVMAPPLLEVRRLAGATPEASTQDDWQPIHESCAESAWERSTDA